ncbi:MAG: alpha-amylase family glycosyl hydrolase [Chloroflexota bacterium]|nr:alpha-amylase family glycosyl hydrolase [Chloroflexota bacterium]
MREQKKQKLHEHLEFLYGESQASEITARILSSLERHKETSDKNTFAGKENKFSEKDIILITYGDIIKEPSQPALKSLKEFLDKHLAGKINTVHILPFFPYSSDDGFSVIDYRKVDPELGTWEDVRALAKSKKLMFDAVINHISRESKWFKGFLEGDPKYQDYFIQPDHDWDLSNVVRPRTSPLLTEVDTKTGPKKVWTTFSADQIDLNYANPEVLLEILDVLLFYIRQGATIIRLDAIAYLWKESGTTCIHLPETHRVIKLLRLVLEEVYPEVVLITETNVPHLENISYFGEFDPETGRTDEAHMVYQFPLAPLVLHTLISGSAKHLTDWVDGLASKGVFFNFIASHDGIGVLPAKGILSEDELHKLIDQVHRHGGLLSHRSNPDGSETVYELNTTLYDALNDPELPDPLVDIERFLASQVILISLAGVPGIYYHSLFGSRNALANVQKTGRARSINREKFSLKERQDVLENPENIHAKIFNKFRDLLSIRIAQPAFHPNGSQKVARFDDRVFALERNTPDNSSAILTLVNISSDSVDLTIDSEQTCLEGARMVVDLISSECYHINNKKLILQLKPYQYLWLKSG